MTDDGFTGAPRPASLPTRSPRQLLAIIGAAAILGGVFVGALLQFISLPASLAPPPAQRVPAPAQPDPLGQLTPFTGSWQGTREKITIDTGNGVVQIVRESQRDDELRLDLLAAAPVRLQAAQGLLELETPEGMWRLALLPREPRPELRIIYADGREAHYD